MGKFVGCNKPVLSAVEGRSALHRMVWDKFIRRNALRLLTPYGVRLTRVAMERQKQVELAKQRGEAHIGRRRSKESA